jgi:putative heme-binding domain-containing protein
MRLGEPSDAQKQSILAQLDSFFPSADALLNRELAAALIYLKAPNIVSRCVEQLGMASAQEDQIHFAFSLREVKEGWDEKSRLGYFRWFFDVASARGGASFGGFLSNIRNAALENLTDEEKSSLGELAGNMPSPKDPLADLSPRELVSEWTVDSLQTELDKLNVKPDFDAGRALTATAQCFKCHRFKGQGGIQGPDLTAAGKRFNDKDMLITIVDPNKDDKVVVGRVANLSGDTIKIVTNMLAPGDFTNLVVDDIIERRPSPVSMMPAGLLETFKPEEVAQILAYLRSGGDADHEVYQ